jgi:hypothetical protein
VKTSFLCLSLAIVALTALGLTSCSYTQAADGSRSFSVDGAAVVKVIEAK